MRDPSPPEPWWMSLPPPEKPSTKWLATLQVLQGSTPFDMEAIGLQLRHWQCTAPRAGHIWGLDDLLAGRPPRTPPVFPLSYSMTADACEPVALICIGEGVSESDGMAGLEAALGDLKERVLLQDVGTYILWQT